MIIDLILDKKDGLNYDPKEFYNDVLIYENTFNFEPKISLALDYGENSDVQKALCEYIEDNDYNPEIKDYINSVNWLEKTLFIIRNDKEEEITRSEAIEMAKEWQQDFSDCIYSYEDLATIQSNFEYLADYFDLVEEFKENSIL